jgi:heme/copper-type cytochrome/quinol oxidase subunit 4
MLESIRNWLSPATREKLYTAIATLAPILVAAGVITPNAVDPIMVLVGAGLQMFAGLLALLNLRPTEAARWFVTVGRGLIYGGAATVAGAVVTLGFITQDWATGALTYLSLGLTALQAILAVVTPKEVTFEASEVPVVAKAIVTPDDAVVEPVVETGATGAKTVQASPTVVLDSTVESHGDGRDL